MTCSRWSAVPRAVAAANKGTSNCFIAAAPPRADELSSAMRERALSLTGPRPTVDAAGPCALVATRPANDAGSNPAGFGRGFSDARAREVLLATERPVQRLLRQKSKGGGTLAMPTCANTC